MREFLGWFLIECRKIKIKVIDLFINKKRKQRNENMP